jgi:hypothetical protein
MELYIAFGFLLGIAVSAGVAVCWKRLDQAQLQANRMV